MEVDSPLLGLQQVVLLHGQLGRALGWQVLEAHAQLGPGLQYLQCCGWYVQHSGKSKQNVLEK